MPDDARKPAEVIADLVAMHQHVRACIATGNEIVIRDAVADVARVLDLMAARGETKPPAIKATGAFGYYAGSKD